MDCRRAWYHLGTVIILLVAAPVCAGAQQESPPTPLVHYDVTSGIAREHTEELRAAQQGLLNADNGEDIVFVLNDGLYVQFANGTGRRKIISRGTGYTTFFYPAWSLDGRQIAFAANRTDPRVVDLVVANADGSNPTVIAVLEEGYYNSYISSISWHWGNQYIMFSYSYNDWELNVLMVVCTVRKNGTDFAVGPGPDRNSCQYEPVNGSSRYAYTCAGRPFYFNSDLRVSNLAGTDDQLWLQVPGTISAFTHVTWNGSNSLYVVARSIAAYPNREVLFRVDKTSGGSTYTAILQSDPGGNLFSPTLSPDRRRIYNSELTSTTTTLYESVLGTSGSAISVAARGGGMQPNWRQAVPTTAVAEGGKDALPTGFALHQNYPNPFNPATRICIDLPTASSVTLSIFNQLGQRVATLIDGVYPAGTHEAVYEAHGLPSGVYWARLQAGSYSAVRKMLLVR